MAAIPASIKINKKFIIIDKVNKIRKNAFSQLRLLGTDV
jgi:hypothetical protein